MMSLENLINEYKEFLDNLYQENHILNGIDVTPLNIIKPEKFMNKLLYYDDGKLTDKFFIKHVVVSPLFEKQGNVYCMGNINVGDYVTTCNIYGVAMKAPCEEVAFGKVKNIIQTKSNQENIEFNDIRLIDVEFF